MCSTVLDLCVDDFLDRNQVCFDFVLGLKLLLDRGISVKTAPSRLTTSKHDSSTSIRGATPTEDIYFIRKSTIEEKTLENVHFLKTQFALEL